MKTTLSLLTACLIGQVAQGQLYCNEVPNGGFENGCGTFVANCTAIGTTGWTYYATQAQPTLIVNTATGIGCTPYNYTDNYMGVGVGDNPPTWNGSPANEHYVTIRNSATDGNTRQRGVYTQLANPLVAGAEYRFKARYNYRSIVGPGSYARIYLRTIDNGEFGCTSYGSWYTHDGASWQITSTDHQEEWLTLEGTFTATGNEAGVAVHAMFKNIDASQYASVKLYVDAVELYRLPSCPGDFNGDGVIGQADINVILAHFGQYVDTDPCLVNLDIYEDGIINTGDLGEVLGLFGTMCKHGLMEDDRNASKGSLPKLQVYPNPSSDKLFCTLTDVEGAEWAEVISLRGEVVLRQRITDQNLLTLDIADLAKGTYLMRLMTTSGERSSIFVKE